MTTPIQLLFVDDDQAMRDMVKVHFQRHGFEVRTCGDGNEALDALGQAPADVVVSDVSMMGLDGVALCERIAGTHPGTPVILLTAFGSMDSAVAGLRAGAEDFLTKPIELDHLRVRAERAAERRRLAQEVRVLRETVSKIEAATSMIGVSPPMRRLNEIIDRVANVDVTVLIRGESGTGKELVARALWQRSRRAQGPFVPLNCAAVPPSLLEAELFGHAKGAFTDARHARAGLFALADGGTILLDEIGEMPLDMQVKLLRALQERKARAVGGDREIDFDVRLIAATNTDLEGAVEDGIFRADLYYRINVVCIDVPPLRRRGDDILLLAQHFIAEVSERAGKKVDGLSVDAAQRLMRYHWPGNVRELHNAIERAVALTRYSELTIDDLPEPIRQYATAPATAAPVGWTATDRPTLAELERSYVTGVLDEVGGNKTAAARILGFDRRTLYRKLQRYERGLPDEQD